MNNYPKKRIKVPPKVKKLNVLIVEVWDTLLLIVLALKISKSLCRLHKVILTLKKVVLQLLKMQGTILMFFLTFIASMKSMHDSDSDYELMMIKRLFS